MNVKYIAIIIGIVVVIGGGILVYDQYQEAEMHSEESEEQQEQVEIVEVDISEWKIYRNDEVGLEIKYPPSFTVEEIPSFTKIIFGNEEGSKITFRVFESNPEEVFFGLRSVENLEDIVIDQTSGKKRSFEKNHYSYFPLSSDFTLEIAVVAEDEGDKIVLDSIMENLHFVSEPRLIAKNPTVRVLTPNGGEIWQTGKTHAIAWDIQGVSELNRWAQNIYLVDGPDEERGFVFSSPLSNTSDNFLWTVPNDFAPGSYRVRIEIVDQIEVHGRLFYSDLSNGHFEIVK